MGVLPDAAVGAGSQAAPMKTSEIKPRQTNAFYAQAIISFGVSVTAVGVGILHLTAPTWERGFLGLGMLYVVTSAFTLAKCVRDQHETNSVLSRIDEAKLERFLADHDPFRSATP